VRLLPGALALRSARRATRTLFRQIVGSGGVDVSRPPLAVRITDSPTATADPGGGACAFYAGVIAEIMHCYTGRRAEVQHPRCRARQAPECEWKVASG
jgi:predicted hydrocarbon binding protein